MPSREGPSSTRAVAIDKKKGAVRLSRIFKWYGEDFAPDRAGLLRFIAPFLYREDEREYLKENAEGLEIDYLAYDWTAARGRVSARLRITNSGVGHYFPTYVTPLVVIKGFLTDAKGKALKGTVKEAAIGRKVSLDLSKELFDTRIPPFRSFEFDYGVRRPARADRLVFEAWVYPDAFYKSFFKNALEKGYPAMKMEELKEALKTTSGSGYLLFKKEMALKDLSSAAY